MVHILAAVPLLQLSVTAAWKEVEAGPRTWAPATHMRETNKKTGEETNANF